MVSRAPVARAGQTVRVGATGYQPWSAALGGGWWAVPLDGGPAIRLRRDSRTGQWRTA